MSKRMPSFLQALLALVLLAVVALPLSAPAVSPEPAQAEFDFVAEEGGDEGEEEAWEREETEDEEEEAEEEELRAKGADPLPPECLLRTADPSVVVQLQNGTLRLTVHYTTDAPTKVGIDYWLKGGKGTLQLGSVTRRLERHGALHLSRHLDEREAVKVRAARAFIIDLDVPAAPSSCERHLTLRLGAKDLDRSRATWSERPS